MSHAAIEISALWDLAPSPSRVDEIDSTLRLRLADSFEYLNGLSWIDTRGRAAVLGLTARLKLGPISPWVFCLYSRLVTELSLREEGTVKTLDALATAAYLPAREGVIKLLDPKIPNPWWNHFQLLLDTDETAPFRFTAPTTEQFSRCKQEIAASLKLLRRIDPVWHDEIHQLLRSTVLGLPANIDSTIVFNGASAFFLWGAALINADISRAPIVMVDLLVHESSHALLFGLSSYEGLTLNGGEERYESPVRPDKRPIDGIFHACFVTTRVHLAMTRLLDSGLLDKDDTKLAVQHCRCNEEAARESMAVLARYAKTTRVGKAIIRELQDYWARQAQL